MSANTNQRRDVLADLLGSLDKQAAYHRERGDDEAASRVAAKRDEYERRAAEGARPPEPDSPAMLALAAAVKRQNLNAARRRAPGAKLTYLRRSLRDTCRAAAVRRAVRRTPLLVRGARRPRARRSRPAASASRAGPSGSSEPPGLAGRHPRRAA